jgi:hypothetical protein
MTIGAGIAVAGVWIAASTVMANKTFPGIGTFFVLVACLITILIMAGVV